MIGSLETRKKELVKQAKKLKSLMRNPVSGVVRVFERGKSFSFYLIEKGGSRNGKYVGKKDRMRAIKILQYGYWQKASERIEKELQQIQSAINFYEKGTFEDIYERYSAARRHWIEPLVLPDEQYINEWMSYVYEPLVIEGERNGYITDKGEEVRSKSELLIANALHQAGIPYFYEKPLYLSAKGENVRPDFTILDVKRRRVIYWEHLGLMSDPLYAEKNCHKINYYQLSGYRLGHELIITMETEGVPLNMKIVHRFINSILSD